MLDIAAQILVSDSQGPEATTLQQGDVVAVYPASQVAEWSAPDGEYVRPKTSDRTAYIFIVGVPINDIAQFLFLVQESEYGDTPPSEPGQQPLRIRKWGTLKRNDRIPPGLWAKWVNAGYVTISWEQAKIYIERRYNGAQLTDAELTAEH